MKGTSIGEFEELVVLVVAILQGNAYGLAIMDEVRDRTGRKVTISTIHATLNRLEKKGFVQSHLGGASETRGGRNKRLFEVTASGKQTVNEVRILREQLWQAVPKIMWQFN